MKNNLQPGDKVKAIKDILQEGDGDCPIFLLAREGEELTVIATDLPSNPPRWPIMVKNKLDEQFFTCEQEIYKEEEK